MPFSAGIAPAPDKGPVPSPEAVPKRPRRRRRLYLLFWAVPAILAGVVGWLQWAKSRPDGREAGRGGGAALATAAVSFGDVASTIRISGTITAVRSAAIRAPRILGSRGDFNRGGGGAHSHGPGGHPDFTLTLLRLAKAGTQVRAGEVVAEFDPENQAQRRDDYQDSVVQLKASIGKMVANLAATKEAHDQKVRTAWAEWQKALLDLKTVRIRSDIDAEKLRLTAEEADLTHQQLLTQRALLEESQGASIRTSELLLAQSAIELERAQANVNRMSMTTPIDGIVVVSNVVLNGDLRQIREGDQVSAGQPVVYVVDPTTLALDGTANQVDADRMRLGMGATVRVDAYPGLTVAGTVTGLGAMAKLSSFRGRYVGEIPVRVHLTGRDSRILPDLTGSAEILIEQETRVTVAPRPALFSDNGAAFVFLREGDRWTRRQVVTGLSSATHVAVRAGLQAGDIVAMQRPL